MKLFKLIRIQDQVLSSFVFDGGVSKDHLLLHFIDAFFKDLIELLILNNFLFFGEPNSIVLIHLAEAFPMDLIEVVELRGELFHDDSICFCIMLMLIGAGALFFN